MIKSSSLAKIYPKHSAKDYRGLGVRLDPLKRTNHCSSLLLKNLHSYLDSHPSDPFTQYIPSFSETTICSDMICMVMPEVDTPFTSAAFKAGRNLESERQLAASMANVTKRVAAFYASQTQPARDSFITLFDFSLQNVGIAVGVKGDAAVQFVDLESFHVADGGIGTLLAFEDVIDGYSILRTDDVDPSEYSIEEVHKKFKCSTVVMFAVLSVKALFLSRHPDLDLHAFEILLYRPPISDSEQAMYIGQFKDLFGVDLNCFLSAITNDSCMNLDYNLLLTPETFPLTGPTLRLDRQKERHSMSTALSKFSNHNLAIAYGMDVNFDPCLMLFNFTASAYKLGSGSYGTIVRAPFKVNSTRKQRYVMKVWPYVVNFAPNCQMCTEKCSTKLQRISLAHYCRRCNVSLCPQHLDKAIAQRRLHIASCKYA